MKMESEDVDSDCERPCHSASADRLSDCDPKTPPKNKRTYYSAFQDEWLYQPQYSSWLTRADSFTAKCRLCLVSFTVKHDGEKAVRTHSCSKRHQTACCAARTNSLMTAFLPKKDSTSELNVAAIEVASVYHNVVHCHSYSSFDCSMKLNKKLFADSDTAKKVHCGRTKAEAIVENILAPHSMKIVLEEMHDIAFAVATDASNHGNRKMFPVAVRYFNCVEGVQNKLIDFYEDSDETAAAVSQKLIDVITKHGLHIQNVSAYTADNASVNYGKNKSVYKMLTNQNPSIMKANCNCHVIHNAARYACKTLKFDVENLVLKVYSEFSVSAKRSSEVLACFEFLDMNPDGVLRHVVTRWLSLFTAVDKLLSCWPAIKLYFINKGEDDCPKVIWDFVKGDADGLSDDSCPKLSIPESYLFFVHHFMHVMHTSILFLESNYVFSTDVHGHMCQLRTKLSDRIQDKFFGGKLASSSKYLEPSERAAFTTDALEVYNRALSYLSKWYDFDGSPLKLFGILKLDSDERVDFQDILNLAEHINVAVDNDELYDEVSALNVARPQLCTLDKPLDEKWAAFFSRSECRNMNKIVGRVLSIPVSNAFVERIFSMMGQCWTDDRNRMRSELVKAELMVKINFGMPCANFYDFLCLPAQRQLLKCSLQTAKYSFK